MTSLASRSRVELLEEALGETDVVGHAVLIHTGGDAGWGTDRYAEEAPFLDDDGVAWLSERRPALVGIDSVNIDDRPMQPAMAPSAPMAAMA